MTIDDLIDVLTRIANVSTLDARLWGTADMAVFLKLNTDHARVHIMSRKDFPAPVDLPGRGKEPIRRYRTIDVRDWAEKWRGK